MGQANSLQLRFDAFELDEADARLKRDGKPVALPPKAFGVLCTPLRQEHRSHGLRRGCAHPGG